MNFDELLDFLFHKWIGVCISIATVVLMTLGLTSCLPLDFCACWCGVGGCYDASSCFEDCSQDCDDNCFECFGGQYDSSTVSGYRAGSSCALNECLFGRYGCDAECGSCYTDCGGVNLSLFEACFEGDCSVCYTSSQGFKRASCLNCITYCDGTNDPDSPNYQPEYLYSIKVVDYYGNQTQFSIYANTTTANIPYESIPGMIFKGFYSEPNGQGTLISQALPAANATIYAYYTDMFEGIKFDFEVYYRKQQTLGGTSFDTPELITTFSAYSGDSINYLLPLLPAFDGYTFNCWRAYVNGGVNYEIIGDENGIIQTYDTFQPYSYGFDYHSSSMTVALYADYKITSYEVKLISPLSTKNQDVAIGTVASELYTLMSQKYGEKLFAGFSLDEGSDILIADDYEIHGDTALYAVYRDPVTITFKDNEELSATYTETYYEGQNIELPVPKSIPDGKEFDYWTYSTDYSKKLTTLTVSSLHESIILIAVYKDAEYTITFFDGTFQLSTMTYKMGNTTPFTAISKEHYVFDGWYKNPEFTGNKYESISATDHSDYSLYAKFTPKKYMIELQDGGGILSDYDVEVTYGQKFTLPVPTRTGYTFGGWYCTAGYNTLKLTESDGKSLDVFKKYDGYSYPDKNDIGITVSPKWIPNVYKVSFYVDGSVASEVDCNHNYTVTAPSAPSKAGYTFDGWYVGNTLYDFSSSVTSNLSITAKFTPITYTITLKVTYGGEFSDGNNELIVKYVYDSDYVTVDGVKVNFSGNNAPIRAGYAFTGWVSSSSSTGTTYIRKDGSVSSYLKSLVTNPGITEYVLYSGWTADNN